MREHALDADRADDDAGDDREVPVRVGLERHPDARLAPRVAEPVFRGTGGHVEVQPPQAQGRHDAEHGRGEQRHADRLAGAADPDGDDRFTDSEMMNRPWRSVQRGALWMRQLPSREVR